VTAGRYVVVCYLHSNPEERLGSDDIPRPQLDVTGTPSYPGVND